MPHGMLNFVLFFPFLELKLILQNKINTHYHSLIMDFKQQTIQMPKLCLRREG